ncbi:MAG: hypothetical protein HYV60_08210, partial [Planctomycetia bacterium]|nr:hypothetical protein [Planctomycetia bacterium]
MLSAVSVSATELVRLTPDTWDEYAPAGKEVDCIYGDYVLRNDKMIVVIAEPLPTRHANLTVHNNGAMIIDLTRRDMPNDQLSAYHPNGMQVSFHSPDRVAIKCDGNAVSVDGSEIVRGGNIEWQCSTTANSGLEVTVRYTLVDGSDVVKTETIVRNPTAEKIEFTASDYMRADRSFEFGGDPATGLFWAHDDWFKQAYGVIVEGRTLKQGGSRGSVLEIQQDGNAKISLAANESTTISRSLFPGASLLEVRGIANRAAGIACRGNTFRVADKAGPVVHAKLTVSLAGQGYGSARTDTDGKVKFMMPRDAAEFNYVIEASGGRRVEGTYKVVKEDEVFEVELEELGYV